MSTATRRASQPRTPIDMTIPRLIWMAVVCIILFTFISRIPATFDRHLNVAPDIRAMLDDSGLPANLPAYFTITLEFVTMLTFTGFAVLLYWRRSDDPLALFVGLMLMLTAFIYTGARAKVPLIDALSVLLIAAGETSQVTFFYVFPDGRFHPRRFRWLILPIFLWRTVVWGVIYTQNVGQGAVEVGIVVLFMAVGMRYQVQRYRQFATPTQRQQMKGLLVGLVVTVTVVASFIFAVNIFGLVDPTNPDQYLLYLALRTVEILALYIFPLTLSFAILRYRLWDIDLAVNRSLVYGGASLLLAVVFVGAALALQSVLDSALAFAISAVGAGILFNPTRQRMQRMIDRRLYGFRFDQNQLQRRRAEVIIPGLPADGMIGKYRVTDVIGRGGMGEVYRGHNGVTHAAIKILPAHLTNSSEHRIRFEREVMALQRLKHPNIIPVYDAGQHNGVFYLAMEYVAGVELGDHIRARGGLGYEDARDVIRDVASALDYMHGQGMIHRDIKSSNIMLRLRDDQETYQAILMDFGLIKMRDAESDLTGTGAIGTIDYMAPEQIQMAHEVDHRADIYALGVVLYEMLTGQKVFKGTLAQVMFAHIMQPVPNPRDLVPDLPHPVAAAVLKALEKDPERRFQSAGEFAAALG